MKEKLTLEMLEYKLAVQLVLDSKKPSRQRRDGDAVTVKPSGTALGLALRISMITGEDEDDIMNRVGNE